MAMPPGDYVQDVIPQITQSNPTFATVPTSVRAGTSVSTTTTVETPTPKPTHALESLGPYKCSPGAILSAFSQLLDSYNLATQNTLEAHLTFYIFNIHAAAAHDKPNDPAPSPTSLPSSEALIGSSLFGNLSAYIYTPANLENHRANLNSTWFTVPERYRPITDYYNSQVSGDGIWSTPDGWPSESFIEFSNSKRSLLQFGTVDQQMNGVITPSELEIIFSPNSIFINQTDVAFNDTGGISHGCYMHPVDTDLKDSNSTWANTPLNSISLFRDMDSLSSSAANYSNYDYAIPTNLVNCGISPLLNTTLGRTADIDPRPYKAFAAATMWSFGPDEPQLYNASQSSGDDNINILRCSTSDTTGRWSVTDCGIKHHVACRASPLNWTVSSFSVSYSFASTACPTEFTFSAPASALENAYLTAAIRRNKDYKRKNDRDPGPGVLLAFNNLDVQGCWVLSQGGANATCPYDSGGLQEFSRQRTIVVPTVAAVIVLVVTALTLLTKGWGNRRGSKKRSDSGRGKANGFVYEGVPS